MSRGFMTALGALALVAIAINAKDIYRYIRISTM
jgi:hypothetical protein